MLFNIEIPENLVPTQVVISLRYFQYDGNTTTEPAYFACIFGAFPPGSTKIIKKKLHGNPRPKARQVLFSKPVVQGYCSLTRERHVWMFPIPNMVKTQSKFISLLLTNYEVMGWKYYDNPLVDCTEGN